MQLTLTAEPGRPTGSRRASRLRLTDQVPGVVYGLGGDSVALSVDRTELRHVLTTEAGLNALITLRYGDAQDLTIVKDIQRDPVRRDLVHVDFLRVDPDAEVTVEVPVILIGEAKEVENMRGIVEQQLKTLAVTSKPGAIPSQLETDISELKVGSSITVADLVLPEGSRTEMDPEAPVVSGVATRFSVLAAKGLTAAEIDAAMEAEAAEAAGIAPAGEEAAAGQEASSEAASASEASAE